MTNGSLVGSNRGGSDAFVAKYSAAGTLLWIRQLGTPADDQSYAAATDGNANVYITGSTNGSLVGSNRGGSDAFVAKYSAAGTLLWIRQLGTSGGDVARAIATDRHGNVYISGNEGREANFFDVSVLLARYSSAAVLLWKQSLPEGVVEAYGIAPDGDGNAYVCGEVYNPSGGDFAYIAKYSATGTRLWSDTFGGGLNDSAGTRGVATDSAGHVYVVGTGSTTGGAFVSKYSPAGALLWIRRLRVKSGPSAYTYGHGIATNGEGSVYITGYREDNSGEHDAFVAKYSAAGVLLWERQLRTPKDDRSNGVAADANDNVYISGITLGSLGGRNQGQSDAFVAKYSHDSK